MVGETIHSNGRNGTWQTSQISQAKKNSLEPSRAYDLLAYDYRLHASAMIGLKLFPINPSLLLIDLEPVILSRGGKTESRDTLEDWNILERQIHRINMNQLLTRIWDAQPPASRRLKSPRLVVFHFLSDGLLTNSRGCARYI